MITAQSASAFIETEQRLGAHNYAPLDVVISHGEGVWLYDVEGRRYLDCISAYSAVNQGHRHPRIVAALVEQAGRIALTSRALRHDRFASFLERLTAVCRQEMALPVNTGVEAVETAIKLARRWGYRVKGIPAGQARIVVARNNFHGRTTTVIGFSSEEQYRADFGPFTPNFDRVTFGDIDALREAIGPQTCAVLLEPIQGEGGVVVPPEGYLRAVRELCSEQRVLFVADEIQTGFGRTGDLFACDHEGVVPDILIVGKALGGGLYPVSAALASRELMLLFGPGDHGSTFGGNPLACAVGEAALDVLVDEHLAERARRAGARLSEGLRAAAGSRAREVRGRGLLLGVDLYGPARPLANALRERGVLAKDTHGTVLRIAPPLVIEDAEIDMLLSAFAEAIATL
ncbi:ornithine--oxo-acid transaminase [bacterium]|nr:MAG: ornithine--oxo-acid transaminase [bacterium]